MSSRQQFSPSYEFHPEFGYLCPSRQLRQNVRVGLAAAGFGILLGLVGAMMLVPRHGSLPARTDSTLAVAPPDPATEAPPAPPAFTDAPAPPPATAPSVAPTTPAEPAVSTDRVGQLPPSALPASPASAAAKVTSTEPPPAVAEEPCTEETWPYFDSKCLWGPARKVAKESPPPRARAPAQAAVPAAASRSARAHRSERRVAANERRGAANERRAATTERRGGDEPRVVAHKKTRSASARRRVREADPRAAYAASPFGFQANSFGGRFADSTRYGRRRDWGGGGWSW